MAALPPESLREEARPSRGGLLRVRDEGLKVDGGELGELFEAVEGIDLSTSPRP